MTRNVLSWGVAIKKGFPVWLYSYAFEAVPFGEFEAVLDCKVWAKKVMGINCYFTQLTTEKKFCVTVYCHHETGQYKLKDCDTDFTTCPLMKTYVVNLAPGESNKVVLISARLQ